MNMLSFFKKVFKVTDIGHEDEEKLRIQVEKLERFYETKGGSDNLINDCNNLFAGLIGRKIENNENPTSELANENDGYSEMPNIGKPFHENCKIQLEIGEQLESENLTRPGLRVDDRNCERPNIYNAGGSVNRMFGRRRSYGRRENAHRFHLEEYKVPGKVYTLFRRPKIDIKLSIDLKLNQDLTSDNYIERFNNLLWLEEAHLVIEMRRYDMKGIRVKPCRRRGRFSINVPGLAEGRPSLVAGDMLVLISNKRPKGFEGYITKVELDRIIFDLNEQFGTGSFEELLFDVYFKSSRVSNQRLHHGVSLFDTRPLIKSIIFPKRRWFEPELYHSLRAESIIIRGQDLIFYCKQLNNNQKQAVISILKSDCRPMPYIVYGPPGTGKTMTLVEAILQTHKNKADCNILVCVNSNSGVDIIAERVLKIGDIKQNELIRFSAMSRDPVAGLKPITQNLETLTKSKLKESRIVFTTLIQAGALYGFNHKFDYLYIDEAGHATEPETLIPVNILKNTGLLVLAGDFHQLGPVVFSETARKYGLGKSLLQRLSERPRYQRKQDGYDNKYITKLTVTNRSDIELLKVNNRVFYDSELTSTVETRMQLLKHFGVKKPIIFEPIIGFEKQERQSPSRCNPTEALACVRYAYRLQKGGMKPENIGIITPYKLQAEKLKFAFAKCKLQSCKIASVEEFQGDERQVIIISTVRTARQNKNTRIGLNFLFEKTRFNVATSRAKYMNILIGDAEILKQDICWREYIEEAETLS